jgi:pilus assembly protein CpaB
MNIRRLTLAMAGALLISALCTYLLSRTLVPRVGAHTNELRYVAPTGSLAAGQILKLENLEMVSWPANAPVPGAATRPEDLVGRALLYPMDKGQPITDKFVSSVGAGFGLAGRIPDGMRAVSLRSDEVMGVGGFLLPGSHLDVLVTYRSEHATEPVTLTVLQDAVLLAAGHQVQPDPEGKPATATVVTLLLTPNDAERAVLASTQGTIHFVLRSGSDTSRAKAAPVMLSQLSGIPAQGPATTVVKVPVTTPVARGEYVIDTIQGDKQTREHFSVAAKR